MSFEVGEEVMAPWGDDGYLYPAIVVSTEGGERCHIAYLDGDEGDVDASAIAGGVELAEGSTANVNWKGKGRYYNGVIQQRVGRAFFFHYEDGDKGWATLGQCRIVRDA